MTTVQPAAAAADAAERPAAAPRGRLWIVSELYYPEETSTGYVMTALAESLAAHYPVSVLCGQPTYSARGLRAPSVETRRGVVIRRCSGLTLNKDILAFRLANLATLTLSVLLHSLKDVGRNDLVIVVTNPPALPFLMLAACRVKGARCVLLIHDVYPDAPIAAGLLRPRGVVARVWARATAFLYRHVSHICVIGRDMAALVATKMGAVHHPPVTIIANWAEETVLRPVAPGPNALLRELGLLDKFVVQYCGNLGRVHDIESLVEAARVLRESDPDVHFVFIGAGAKKAWLMSEIERIGLDNLTVLPPKPRSEEDVFLRGCDVAIMAMVPGMAGVGVPSRLYNIMAAGKPVIAAVDERSEPAIVIQEERIGWVIAPGDPAGIVAAIRSARADRARLREMSVRAAMGAQEKYTLADATAAYCRLVERVWSAAY
ncbi:MAG TPA: glycosyltransferase family 4 protein [Vicinamibacterales bacterium]|nr:glycosyltransferase family 4 protein [Vicinamibacterales bacterium]